MIEAEVTIERMAYGGGGVAHHDDAEFVVPFTLTGERVRVGLQAPAQGQRIEATLHEIVTPSQKRISPECIHFKRCGGCQYQHIDYLAQLEIKRDIVKQMLERAGIPYPELAIHASTPYDYRNRIQLRIEREGSAWKIGYNERSSHRFMAASMCPVTSPPMWTLAEALRDALSGHSFGSQPLHEAELMCNEDASQIQVVLMLDVEHASIDRDAPKHFRELCDTLARKYPALRGAGLWVWSAAPTKETRGRAQQRMRVEVASWGARTLPYNISGQHFEIERGGFFQVNRSALPKLVQIATERATGNRAWDLYAGAGLFSAQLASRFGQVTAVEIGERSYRSLAGLLSKASGQHRAFQMDTLHFLKREANRLSATDFVIVDPPRSGLGGPTARALAEVRAREIRYVSCDPITLVRDLKTLIESGYRLAEFALVDMFPQTFHLESVVRLVLD